MDGCEKVSGELIVSGGDPSEILEPAKASLDDVSAFVGTFVEAMERNAILDALAVPKTQSIGDGISTAGRGNK